MMKPLLSALLLGLLLSSCATKPKGPEFDWDPQRKRMLDTEKNRERYIARHMELVQLEASGQAKPNWKQVFMRLDGNFDNPEVYKALIITERRKAGLPELKLSKN